MAAVMPEIRTAVMIMVEVSWHDHSGTLQTMRARMEDRSAGGACIRSKRQVGEGSKVKVQWRFEQFSGIVKYCRNEGREYVVGLQRIAGDGVSSPAAPRDLSLQQVKDSAVTSNADETRKPVVVAQPEAPKKGLAHESQPLAIKEPPALAGTHAIAQPIHTASLWTMTGVSESEDTLRHRVNARDGPRIRRREASEVPRQNELQKERAPKRNQTDEEREPMANKWLSRAPWATKTEAATPNSGENINDGEAKSIRIVKENLMPQPVQSSERSPAVSAREVPAFQVELLPMEDIYRTAGIATPRKGYSVTKLVEMINSEHIRGLSRETKRAAILMALDAAGVSLEQVQRDAKSRQNALEIYEAEQKKQAEAEWSRKAEEISHIQAELESIKAHYTSRINRNMEALARDKARFNSWVTTKEQESQSMSEAVDLCMKPGVSEPPSAPARESGLAASAAGGSSAPLEK